MLGLGSSITTKSGVYTTGGGGGGGSTYAWTSSDLSDYTVSGDDTLTLGSTEVDGLDNYLILTQNTDESVLSDPKFTLDSSATTFDVNPNTFSSGTFTMTAKLMKPASDSYLYYNGRFLTASGNTISGAASSTLTPPATSTWQNLSVSTAANGTSLRFSFSIIDAGPEPQTGEAMYVTDLKVSHSDGTVLYQRGPSF